MSKKDMKKDAKKEKGSKKESSHSKRKETVKHYAGGTPHKKEKKEPKKEVDRKAESKGTARIEREEKKKEDDNRKQEEIRSKKRSELEKSIKKLEDKIDDLESKKADAMKEEEENRVYSDKEGSKSHIVNHGSVKVDHLTKQIKDSKEILARKEEALEKLSEETRKANQDEYTTRTALAKIYENNQRDLRKELTEIENAISRLRAEEVKAKNELQDDRAAHEDLIMKKRNAETHKDSLEAEHHTKALFAKESDEMNALHATEKRIRKDLDVIRKKIDENTQAREKAAKGAAIRLDLSKERHEKEVDKMIKNGVHPEENHSRLFTQTAVEIAHRKEDLEAERKKETRTRRRPTMGEDGIRRTSSSTSMKKKTVSKTMPMNDADRDMGMMEDEVSR
jgi:hypothetical protein